MSTPSSDLLDDLDRRHHPGGPVRLTVVVVRAEGLEGVLVGETRVLEGDMSLPVRLLWLGLDDDVVVV
jgi:hypothetical protein